MPLNYVLKVGTRVANSISDFGHQAHCSCCGNTIYYPNTNPLTEVTQSEKPKIVVDSSGTIIKIVEIPADPGGELMGDFELSDPHPAYTVYYVVFDEYPDIFFGYHATWDGLTPIPEET